MKQSFFGEEIFLVAGNTLRNNLSVYDCVKICSCYDDARRIVRKMCRCQTDDIIRLGY